MKKIVRFGTVSLDHFGRPHMTITDRDTLVGDVWRMADGKAATIRVTIQIEEDPKDQSDQGYYFGVVLPAIVEAEYQQGNTWSREEAHEHMKKMQGVSTTKKMTKKQFRRYVDAVCQFAAEWYGIVIPEKIKFNIPNNT